VYRPTPQPAVTSGSCVSYTGFCAQNEVVLQRLIDSADPGDTISICGAISVSKSINITRLSLTVCCDEESSGCSLDNGNVYEKSPLMYVTAGNFTLKGITFYKGHSSSNGGNVALISEGYHSIVDCIFLGGLAGDGYGGNLYVNGAHRVTISGSIFEGGGAEIGGGGAAFFNTRSVNVLDSRIHNNDAGELGAGLHFIDVQSALIHGCSIDDNVAGLFGGGFYAGKSKGILMVVTDSYFGGNTAGRVGAVGMIEATISAETKLEFLHNDDYGNENVARGCSGFFIVLENEYCFDDVSEKVVIPFVPTVSPAPSPTPTQPPSFSPVSTVSPSNTQNAYCRSTIGSCVNSFYVLSTVLETMVTSNVIALCGGRF